MPVTMPPIVGAEAEPGRHRFSLILRGCLAIAASLLLLALPAAGLAAVVVVFAALCAADGIIALVQGVRQLRSHGGWWAAVIQGLVSLALAAVAVVWPGITLLALVWLAAIWAIWQGFTELLVARVAPHGGGWLAFAGALSVILGVLMFVLPAIGIIGLIAMIAAYAFIRGLSLLAAAVQATPPTHQV